MGKYYTDSKKVNEEIKKQISQFIHISELLTDVQKKDLEKELQESYRYWIQKDLDHSNLIEILDYYFEKEWKKTQLNEAEFYKSVCIENAKHNNEPYKVAEKALTEFKKTFNRD